MTGPKVKYARESRELAGRAFVMHERLGFSTSQIAEALGVTASTAANLVGYGRRLACWPGVPGVPQFERDQRRR